MVPHVRVLHRMTKSDALGKLQRTLVTVANAKVGNPVQITRVNWNCTRGWIDARIYDVPVDGIELDVKASGIVITADHLRRFDHFTEIVLSEIRDITRAALESDETPAM